MGIWVQNCFKVPHTLLYSDAQNRIECDVCKVGIWVENNFEVPHKRNECVAIMQKYTIDREVGFDL